MRTLVGLGFLLATVANVRPDDGWVIPQDPQRIDFIRNQRANDLKARITDRYFENEKTLTLEPKDRILHREIIETWVLLLTVPNPWVEHMRGDLQVLLRRVDQDRCPDPLIKSLAQMYVGKNDPRLKDIPEGQKIAKWLARLDACRKELKTSSYHWQDYLQHLTYEYSILEEQTATRKATLRENPLEWPKLDMLHEHIVDAIATMAKRKDRVYDQGIVAAVNSLPCRSNTPDHLGIFDAIFRTADEHGSAWLGAYLRGKVAYDRAWEARGTGWASSVGPNKMAEFQSYSKLAMKYFTAAWKADPTRPHTASMVISARFGAAFETDDLRTWLTRALTVDPDDATACGSAQLWMSPRWGGDVDERAKFLTACRKTENHYAGITSLAIGFFNKDFELLEMNERTEVMRQDVYQEYIDDILRPTLKLYPRSPLYCGVLAICIGVRGDNPREAHAFSDRVPPELPYVFMINRNNIAPLIDEGTRWKREQNKK